MTLPGPRNESLYWAQRKQIQALPSPPSDLTNAIYSDVSSFF